MQCISRFFYIRIDLRGSLSYRAIGKDQTERYAVRFGWTVQGPRRGALQWPDDQGGLSTVD